MALPSVTVTTQDQTFFLSETNESAVPLVGAFYSPNNLVGILGRTLGSSREKQEGVMLVTNPGDWAARLTENGITAGPTGGWATDWWCVNNFLKYGGSCLVGGTGSEVYTTYNADNTPLHKKDYDIDVAFASTGSNSITVALNLADDRGDCFAVIGSTFSAQIQTDLTSQDIWPTAASGSEKYVLVYGHKRFFDDSTGSQLLRTITVAPDVAGCFARARRDTNSWTTPAGFRRGRILGVLSMVQSVDLSSTLATQIDGDGGNIVTTIPGRGTFLMGNNTAYSTTTSVLKKINVSLLVNYIKKQLTVLATDLLFELNNENTRNLFLSAAQPVLRNIEAAGGLYEYRVVCDASNNGPDIVDANKFVADVYIKPAKTAETIIIKIIPVNTATVL
jgi:hypothetical protein